MIRKQPEQANVLASKNQALDKYSSVGYAANKLKLLLWALSKMTSKSKNGGSNMGTFVQQVIKTAVFRYN